MKLCYFLSDLIKKNKRKENQAIVVWDPRFRGPVIWLYLVDLHTKKGQKRRVLPDTYVGYIYWLNRSVVCVDWNQVLAAWLLTSIKRESYSLLFTKRRHSEIFQAHSFLFSFPPFLLHSLLFLKKLNIYLSVFLFFFYSSIGFSLFFFCSLFLWLKQRQQ